MELYNDNVLKSGNKTTKYKYEKLQFTALQIKIHKVIKRWYYSAAHWHSGVEYHVPFYSFWSVAVSTTYNLKLLKKVFIRPMTSRSGPWCIVHRGRCQNRLWSRRPRSLTTTATHVAVRLTRHWCCVSENSSSSVARRRHTSERIAFRSRRQRHQWSLVPADQLVPLACPLSVGVPDGLAFRPLQSTATSQFQLSRPTRASHSTQSMYDRGTGRRAVSFCNS